MSKQKVRVSKGSGGISVNQHSNIESILNSCEQHYFVFPSYE